MYFVPKVCAITLIGLLSTFAICTAQRSLRFAQDLPQPPVDPAVQQRTQNAIREISQGSEQFALDIFQVC